MAMNGTRNSQTFAMDVIPPRITNAGSTAITGPVIHGAMWKVSFTIDEMEFAWTMFPMPNAEIVVRMAKMTPSHFCFIFRSRTYIGPLATRPLSVLMRYFTERTASEYFCGNTEYAGQPHPKHGTGPASGDGCRDTDDVPRADGGCQ